MTDILLKPINVSFPKLHACIGYRLAFIFTFYHVHGNHQFRELHSTSIAWIIDVAKQLIDFLENLGFTRLSTTELCRVQWSINQTYTYNVTSKTNNSYHIKTGAEDETAICVSRYTRTLRNIFMYIYIIYVIIHIIYIYHTLQNI